jgi:hypothetical protein
MWEVSQNAHIFFFPIQRVIVRQQQQQQQKIGKALFNLNVWTFAAVGLYVSLKYFVHGEIYVLCYENNCFEM